MNSNYIDPNTGLPYTNLMNPQVYDKAKDLACGWKWMCQDPCCKDMPWPRGGCSCCDMCDLGENETETPGGGDYTEDPCCYNGTCCACKNVTGDAPPLYPQAIGCGRRHVCKVIKTLPLMNCQLDTGNPDSPSYADLPGRPPHTIVCVRATGASLVSELGKDGKCLKDQHDGSISAASQVHNDLNLINDCNSYNLWVRLKIPVEVIIRDCSGYLYCLKSFITELVRIPLTARVHNLSGESYYLYTKIRIRMCYPNKAEAVPLYSRNGTPIGVGPSYCNVAGCACFTGPTINRPCPFNCIQAIADNAFRHEDQANLAECLLAEDEDDRCKYTHTFGTYHCEERDSSNSPDLQERCSNGNPKLDILIETCVVRLSINSKPDCVPQATN